MRTRRPDPEPLEVDAVTVVTVGTAIWGVALLGSLAFISQLRAAGHLWWMQTALAGFLLGLAGIGYCRRRRDAIRRGAPVAIPAEPDELPPPLG
ncbi:MAG: DUF2530 domain-containing protein [Actinomycetota bacterium]|nr:DUF2530 domain-containing protein [Actinomycetota bacterium]